MWKRHIRIQMKIAASVVLVCALAWAASAQTGWLAPDPAIIARFQDESSQRSRIMETIGYLTDVYGPRLTNSPN
ncbi:MAG TPA: hypothetical protein VGI34_06965, partial [Candidatus Acidoferrales bacterium]